jgi:hypothetical protein
MNLRNIPDCMGFRMADAVECLRIENIAIRKVNALVPSGRKYPIGSLRVVAQYQLGPDEVELLVTFESYERASSPS